MRFSWEMGERRMGATVSMAFLKMPPELATLLCGDCLYKSHMTESTETRLLEMKTAGSNLAVVAHQNI